MMAEVGESISRMPGPPRGPSVADHDHVASLDPAIQDRGQRGLLAFKDAGECR